MNDTRTRRRTRTRTPGWAVCLLATIWGATTSGPALAIDLSRPDSHAPIGVMSEHAHHKGELMLSYRYSWMHMDGNRDGTNGVSASRIVAPTGGNFLATPLEMNMEMQMWGLMYAPLDAVTLTAMIPYARKDMDHINRAGAEFTTRSRGIGDIVLGAILRAYEDEQHQLLVNIGLSFPSGSIDEKDDIPTPTPTGRQRVRLPYPMQIGSGSYDPRVGFTYNGQLEKPAWGGGALSWGAQVLGTFRTAENDNDYRLGHEYSVSSWSAYTPTRWLSTALRIKVSGWGNIRGADPRLVPTMVPTADPDLRAGTQIDIGLSANLLMPAQRLPLLKGFRLAFEVLLPAYRSLDGPQLERDYQVIVGLQKSFGVH